jgi:hypothetical protein
MPQLKIVDHPNHHQQHNICSFWSIGWIKSVGSL